MPPISLEFGYWPVDLKISAGPVSIEPISTFNETVACISNHEAVEDGWFYAPPQQVTTLGGVIKNRPYSARVFSLPSTHRLKLPNSDCQNQIAFHLWSLSFFAGIRLTPLEGGFLDATPIKPSKLVDFELENHGLETAIEMAEAFWIKNQSEIQRTKLFCTSVHTLFLAQNPRLLEYEKFTLLYIAFDACFALAKLIHPPDEHVTHAGRVTWMCKLFKMCIPAWAKLDGKKSEVAMLRNNTIHEALFAEKPLGFALYDDDMNPNLALEMKALICRLLVALLGGHESDYVRSPVNTRQRQRLSLP